MTCGIWRILQVIVDHDINVYETLCQLEPSWVPLSSIIGNDEGNKLKAEYDTAVESGDPLNQPIYRKRGQYQKDHLIIGDDDLDDDEKKDEKLVRQAIINRIKTLRDSKLLREMTTRIRSYKMPGISDQATIFTGKTSRFSIQKTNVQCKKCFQLFDRKERLQRHEDLVKGKKCQVNGYEYLEVGINAILSI